MPIQHGGENSARRHAAQRDCNGDCRGASPGRHPQRGCQCCRYGNPESTVDGADFISSVGIQRGYPELAGNPFRHCQRGHAHEEKATSGDDKSDQ